MPAEPNPAGLPGQLYTGLSGCGDHLTALLGAGRLQECRGRAVVVGVKG
jgi:hypothetical protein